MTEIYYRESIEGKVVKLVLAKERLMEINELKLHDKIETMTSEGFAEYCKLLDGFIEGLPYQDSELKQSVASGDITAFSRVLQDVTDALLKIHADDLAKNCVKLLSDIKTSKPEVAEAYLTYLLTALAMLSIDIQMVMYDNEKTNAKTEQVILDEKEPLQKSILAVDDVPLTLNSLKMILQNTEYKLTCVSSGSTALRFLEDHTADLFILDIEMPQMDGYELALKIRQRGHTTPIIFLTGNSTQDYVLKAIQAGAADFIVKPVSKDFVLEKIRRQLS